LIITAITSFSVLGSSLIEQATAINRGNKYVQTLQPASVQGCSQTFRFSTCTSRQIRSARLLYTGPPDYETIARPFSSDVDPQAYFIRKRQHEAKDSGQLTEIHDIGEVES
jgi:hypothetical protein